MCVEGVRYICHLGSCLQAQAIGGRNFLGSPSSLFNSQRLLVPCFLVPLSSYLEFSSVAARCVRSALKADAREIAAKRGECEAVVRSWKEGVAGPISKSPPALEEHGAWRTAHGRAELHMMSLLDMLEVNTLICPSCVHFLRMREEREREREEE